MKSTIIDFHGHLGGHKPVPFSNPFKVPNDYHPPYWIRDRQLFDSISKEGGPTMSIMFKVGLYLSRLGLDVINNAKDIQKELKLSERVNKLVVLATSPVVTNGKMDLTKTPLYISNRSVMDMAKANERIIPGISINPLADDAEKELESLAAESKSLPNGGKMVFKLFPSVCFYYADGIDENGKKLPYRKKLLDFYDRLAALGITVIVHTGVEEVMKDADYQYFMDHGGDVAKLTPLISTGINVILAHSGYDPSYQKAHKDKPNQFAEVKEAIEKYPNVYTDISGAYSAKYNFVGTIAELLEDDTYRKKMIHGSDFPVVLGDPAAILSSLEKEDRANKYVQKAITAYSEIVRDTTLHKMTFLDKCARMTELTMKALGVDEKEIHSYFTNGARLLGYTE